MNKKDQLRKEAEKLKALNQQETKAIRSGDGVTAAAIRKEKEKIVEELSACKEAICRDRQAGLSVRG